MINKDRMVSFYKNNMKNLEKLENNLRDLDSELSYINADEKRLNSSMIDFSYNINRLYCQVFSEYASIQSPDRKISVGEFNPVIAEITKNDFEIRIRYNMLPAKRNCKISDSNKFSTEFFRAALDKAIKESNIQYRYESKCVIIYNVLYKEEKPADLDNYDFKNITDSICAHFLFDDSPKYMSQFFTGTAASSEPYLEITICPIDKFKDYI